MNERTETTVTTPVTTEVVTTPAPLTAVDQVHATAYDPYDEKRATASKVRQAIWLLVGIVEMLLVIRFVLRALGASAEAGFAQFIYGVSAPLVAPFVGLFGTPQAGGAALETHTLVALVIYALVGWVLTKVAALVLNDTRSATVSRADTVQTRVR